MQVMSKVKEFKVRLPRSEGEKIIRKRERLLKKDEEEKFNQRSLEAFNRLFELNSATNTYILRSGYED